MSLNSLNPPSEAPDPLAEDSTTSHPPSKTTTPIHSPGSISRKSSFVTTPLPSPSMSLVRTADHITPRLRNSTTSSAAQSVASSDRHSFLQHPLLSQEKPLEDQDWIYLLGDDTLLPQPKKPAQCPLFCCFYAEFDLQVGTQIEFQTPPNFMENDIDIGVDQIHEMLKDTFCHVARRRGQSVKNDSEDEEDDDHGEPLVGQPHPVHSDASNDTWSIFDSCREYITGAELSGKIVNLSTHDIHVLTRPEIISDERYERNSFMFCPGFILRRTEDPRPFRSVLSKLALTLRHMEIESQFLSSPQSRPRLQDIFETVLICLNSSEMECNLVLDRANTISLKLFHPPRQPASPVADYQVPLFLRRDWQVHTYDWDLAINWISLHIDGVSNGAEISRKADTDIEMVRACLRVLKHHGVVTMVDMFFFSNRYEATSKVAALLKGNEPKLLADAVEFIVHRPSNAGVDRSPSVHSTADSNSQAVSSSYPPEKLGSTFGSGSYRMASTSTRRSPDFASVVKSRDDYSEIKRAVALLYSMCSPWMSVRDMWMELVADGHRRQQVGVNWRKMYQILDHRRFASFGVTYGLLRRVHCFPMVVNATPLQTESDSGTTTFSSPPQIRSLSPSAEDRTRKADVKPEHTMEELKAKAEKLMDGRHCDDAIACAVDRSMDEIFCWFEDSSVISTYAVEDASAHVR